MKTTSLKLEIQQDNVAVGDTVSGTVKVLEPVDPCEGLDIYLEYSGKHVSATRVGRQLLQAGPLERGQSHSFSITIPPQMPFTFEATHHDLQWKVMARADVAWAMDPKVSLPLTVEARRVPDDPEALAEATRVESPPKAPESLVGQVAMWSVIIVLAVVLFPLLPLLLILIARQQVLKTRVADFEVEVPEGHYLLGQWVPVTLRFRLKRAIEVAGIKLTLQGTESWSSGKSTHTHNFHEQEISVLQEAVLAPAPRGQKLGPNLGIYRSPGQTGSSEPVFTMRTAVKLPRDGLPSVGDGVYYKVKASADVLGWPDPSAEFKIKTVGALVETDPAAPAHDHPQETSPGLVFAARGQDLPEGVEAPTSGSGLWGWILLSLAGVTMAAVGIGLWLDRPTGWPLLIGAVIGLALLGAGLAGFFRKLR